MLLTRFALRNPIVVTLFYICVAVAGVIALARMGKSILPPIALPEISITAPYPGASASEIERLVVEPIEEQLRGIRDLQRVSSYAEDGIGEMTIQFRYGSNLDVDRENAQQAVDAAAVNMPPDLVAPSVTKDDPSQIPVLEEGVTSAVLTEAQLSQTLDRAILPAVRAASAVGTVRVAGEVTPQFTIVPLAGALQALRATPLDLVRALAANNAVLPGGSLKSSVEQSSLGIRADATTAEQLQNVPVMLPSGSTVRIRDVARVVDGYADRTTRSSLDGDSAVLLYVSPAYGSDSQTAITSAQRVFKRLAQEYPLIRFQTIRTEAPSTDAALSGVLQTLIEGALLTVVVMLFFLRSWRNALVAAISIPASLCAALAAMWAAGFTIDVLSLMGLSLTIGILVDDSIVIIEAIAKSAERGLRGDEAALAGRGEIGGAAFAITLVDVAVFAPIATMGGVIGQFMREFGLVVVFATAFSLLAAFTIVPLLMARWGARLAEPWSVPKTLPWTLRTAAARRIVNRWRLSLDAFNACERAIPMTYARRSLPFALRHVKPLLAIVILLCLVSLLAAGAIPSEFSPPVNDGRARIDFVFPAGTPIERTDARIRKITSALLSDDAVAHVVAVTGRGFNGVTDVFASNLAQLEIVLSDPTAAGDAITERVRQLQALIPEAVILGSPLGMGGSAPIVYNIAGAQPVVDIAAGRIARALAANPYASDIRTSSSGVGPRVQIGIDDRRALELGITPSDAAETARAATAGVIATKVRTPFGLVDVLVRGDAGENGDMDLLQRFPVRSAGGTLVPLGAVDRVTKSLEPEVIQRENGERIVTISAGTRDGAPIGLVTAEMRKRLSAPGFLPSGTYVQPRGDVEQFLDALMKLLAALGMSVIIVYVTLAILYRSYGLPLVVMATVPLASIGAFGTLFVLNLLRLPGQTLNLYSMLGIVMLVGLVAKNGILLVEYAEREVRAGADALTAIASAAERRFRPIVMTTCAMVAGMLPLALGETAGAQYRKALGSVVIGGLTSSLLLTLFVVPIAYALYRRAYHPSHLSQVPEEVPVHYPA